MRYWKTLPQHYCFGYASNLSFNICQLKEIFQSILCLVFLADIVYYCVDACPPASGLTAPINLISASTSCQPCRPSSHDWRRNDGFLQKVAESIKVQDSGEIDSRGDPRKGKKHKVFICAC